MRDTGAHAARQIKMNGWEVLSEALPAGEADDIAALMGVSEDTVYRWCRRPNSSDDPNATGRRNPIDNILRLLNALYARNPEGAERIFERLDHERALLRKRHGRSEEWTTAQMEAALRDFERRAKDMADGIAEQY